MQLTPDVQRYVYDYLKKIDVTNQEMHDEFYDHILSSYEVQLTKTPGMRIEDFIASNIEEGFGGEKGVRKIINAQQREINNQYRRAILQEFSYFLKWPVILLTASIYFGLYKALALFSVNKVILFSIAISSITPILVVIYGILRFYIECRRHRLPYNYSLKNFMLLNLGLLFGAVPNLYNVFLENTEMTALSAPIITLVALLLTSYLLLTLSYLRVIKKNFTFKLKFV